MRTLIKLVSIDESFRRKLVSSGLVFLQDCSDAENEQFSAMKRDGKQLPEDIVPDEYEINTFQRITLSDQTPEDDLCIIEYMKLQEVAKIRSWVTFFGALTLIGLVCYLLIVLLL